MTHETVVKYTTHYHKTLNPAIWEGDMLLKDSVRVALLKVATAWMDTWGFNIPVLDIILTGSNANYNWTKYSDLDLHIIVDMKSVGGVSKDFVSAYLKVRKQLWNKEHKVTIKKIPVEVYAQDNAELLVATGVFSLNTNTWVHQPMKTLPPKTDHPAITKKVEDFIRQVDEAVLHGDSIELLAVLKRLADFRRAGLAEKGEFSVENLTFKVLRNNGTIGRIADALQQATNKGLTLESVDEDLQEKRVKHFKGVAGSSGGLTSMGRWKKRRAAQKNTWKRTRFAHLAKQKPASNTTIARRTQLAARHAAYKNILRGRDKSKIPYGERRRAERVYKRVYKTTVGTPQTRVRYKYRRKDTTRHSKVRF
jgi:predicted nucleotidyltransferase